MDHPLFWRSQASDVGNGGRFKVSCLPHIDRSGRADWWHGNERLKADGYTAGLLVKHALEFIEQHRDDRFFVYLPHRREGNDYWNDKWGLIPDPSNVSPHVKAMVESIDQGVGRIVASLREWGLDDNTLIFFLSDNGGYTHYGRSHQNISSNGALRGQKTELFEGGHRVPAIAWWPSRVQPGLSSETLMSFDLAPTILRLAGSAMETIDRLDGTDLTRLLLNREAIPSRTLFWRMDDEVAVRRGPWKWIRIGEQQPLLYDLLADLAETTDLSSSRSEMVSELERLYTNWAKNVVVTKKE